MMVIIDKQTIDIIFKEAKETYPNECCGILVGRKERDVIITKVYPAENMNKERLKDRYEIDPLLLLKIEKELDKSEAIIGFYHSHPDYSAKLSPFDLESAWPEYLYLIVSVKKGGIIEYQSYILDEEGKNFKEERIIINGVKK